ncbi:MAG: hypothetical protein QXV21_00800 [Candidatus Bathyarchaeia archaeon]
MAASGTMDVEPIRMILPAADRSVLLWKDIAATPATIKVPAETPPRKKSTQRIPHFNPSLCYACPSLNL